MKHILFIIVFCYTILTLKASNADSLKAISNYNQAVEKIDSMLSGQKELDFERAIFIVENAYWDNQIQYKEFQDVITNHLDYINFLIDLNDESDSMDFSVKINPNKPLDITSIRFTEEEKKEMYQKALANWAIYTYMTDTLLFSDYNHFPFSYNINDPFGMNQWENSQVFNLLSSEDKKGNCSALTSLFKIFSERLNSGAEINIAPGHIYIQHQDHMGDWYNVELATGSHPSDGSIQTLTFTYLEGIKSGIALRRLDLKQDVALCLIYLAKSYEHKFGSKTDDFLLKCAELTLKYDDKNLNAQLLKHQVLAERVVNYSIEKGITEISKLSEGNEIASTYKELEKQTLLLYDLGYHQMPIEMQKTILAGLQHKNGDQPIIVENHTPNPFTTIDVAPEDKRYSTLSGGLFEEVHPIRKYETYRNFVLDTEERKLSKMNLNSENELLIDPVAFAWSIDPLAHEFPSWSPYAAFQNNPIVFTDVTGEKVNWFQSRGAFKLRKALLATPTGRDIWRGIRKSKTSITINVTNQVLVVSRPNGNFTPVEGVFGEGEFVDKGYDSFYKTGSLNVSLGTQSLKEKIARKLGADSWDNLTPEQQNNSLQEELGTGEYEVFDITNQKLLNQEESGNVQILTDPYEGNIEITPPLQGESQIEFLNRVGVHEGTHATQDAKLKGSYNPASGDNLRLNLEKNAYKTESKTIKQQQTNRTKSRAKFD